MRDAGIGPAQVAWAQATLDGAPVAGWMAMVTRLVPAGTRGRATGGFYCSVYDQCWRLDNPSVGASVPQERVTPVPACPRPATPIL